MDYWKIDVCERVLNQGHSFRRANDSSIFICPQHISSSHQDCHLPAVLTLGPYTCTSEGQSNANHVELNRYKLEVFTAVLKGQNFGSTDIPNFVREVVGDWDDIKREYGSPFVQSSEEDIRRLIAIDSLFLAGLLVSGASRKDDNVENFPNDVEDNPELKKKLMEFPGFVQWDPILMKRNIPFARDLFILENQVPLICVKRALMFAVGPILTDAGADNLLRFCIARTIFIVTFFDFDEQGETDKINGISLSSCKHMLDFFYKAMTGSLPPGHQVLQQSGHPHSPDRVIPTITKLRLSGIKVQKWSGSARDVMYQNVRSIIYLPSVKMTGHTECYLRNLLAYETLAGLAPIFSSYVILMNHLIKTLEDVQILKDKSVIGSFLGDDETVLKIWNTITANLDLLILPETLDDFYHIESRSRNWFQRNVTEIKKKAFSSMYVILSLIAAGILIICTVLQTSYTMAGYYKT